MFNSVFTRRSTEIISDPWLMKLVLYLYNPINWPLDMQKHFTGAPDDKVALAKEMYERHSIDKQEFRTLAVAVQKVAKKYRLS